MNRYQSNLALIGKVAEALGTLRDQVVFVGGIVAPLLCTEGHPLYVRPTDDVDVVVETATYGQYNRFIERLRQLRFAHDMDGPLCRFIVDGVKVDVMPAEESVLKFSNKWYQLAFQTATTFVLPSSLAIRVIVAPLFLCTKLDAFTDRGHRDFLTSADIEDVVAVINGRPEITAESATMPVEVRQYLSQSCRELLADSDFRQALPGLLPYGASDREPVVISRMEALARSYPEPD